MNQAGQPGEKSVVDVSEQFATLNNLSNSWIISVVLDVSRTIDLFAGSSSGITCLFTLFAALMPVVTTTQTPTEEPNLTNYNVTFIVIMPAFPEFQSIILNHTSLITNELNDLFKKSSINVTFSSCIFHSFSMVNTNSTTVTAICSFKNYSTIPEIGRVLVYHVFENKTRDISNLGPYILDDDSLYVNDYHESSRTTTPMSVVTLTPTPTEEPNLTDYNVTFIINSPAFQEIVSNSSNHTRMIANELNDLFQKSSINATFSSCIFHSSSMVNTNSSTVTAVCSFKNESTIQQVDRVLVYHVFENNTNDISNLGPYTLDNDSLYLNDFHESPHVSTAIPALTVTPTPRRKGTPIDYNVTFIITSPRFQEIQLNSFFQTMKIGKELNDLFKGSSIKATFSRCLVKSLSVVNGDSYTVTAICSFKNYSTIPAVDRVFMYDVFENKTKDISNLGPYRLANNSLYVNDYHKTEPMIARGMWKQQQVDVELASLGADAPNENQVSSGFNVTFIIISLPYLQALHDNTSRLYQSASTIITHQVYHQSEIS
ncbi:mucin-16-like [Scyliorhinus canicula]|uniref:mucin-16-like n=1 Tax=Scyliorhinus canicula TaxID=7830 RepID=UPI0018F6CEA2|nr:mucin-16-like [Scyliorhinus canicula]